MPTDWIIAPNNADTRHVSANYSWNTYYMTLNGGYLYKTYSSYYSYDDYVGFGYLYSFNTSSGCKYSCGYCNCQVLIMYSPTAYITTAATSSKAKAGSGSSKSRKSPSKGSSGGSSSSSSSGGGGGGGGSSSSSGSGISGGGSSGGSGSSSCGDSCK